MPYDAAPDRNLYGRGRMIAAVSRWLSLGLGLLAVVMLGDAVEEGPALAVIAAYGVFAAGMEVVAARFGSRRPLRILHDVVDALAILGSASFTGGSRSPLWLILYPQVVAVSVRSGLRYAMAIGSLDAAIVVWLGLHDGRNPFSGLYALSLLWCALLGGSVSSYLKQVQARLAQANLELQKKNSALESALAQAEQGHLAQQRSIALVRLSESRLGAINEIANAVNQSLTIDDIFDVATQETRRIVPFDRLTIALNAETSTALELVSVDQGHERRRLPIRREDVSWAFRRATAWDSAAREASPPRNLHQLAASPELGAAATVPLLSKERVIGVLCVSRLELRPFSPAELQLLELVASHVAIALDNARLLEAVRRRGREFESLVEIGRRIVERLEPAEILPLVTRSVNGLMNTHFCLLTLREGEMLRLAAYEGLEPEVAARFRNIRVGESLTGWVAREGRPLAVVDMHKDRRSAFMDVLEQYGYHSFLGVPLRRGAEVLGTLEVVSKEPRQFRAEEEEILTAFADVTAVAIEHARLFQQRRDHVAALEDANLRLEELDRMRQEYLRNVSHEFRTPLTVIRGWADYLRGAAVPDEASLRDVMRIVIDSCDRVIDMVDTLIEVSRIEQAGAAASLHVQNVDISELISRSLEPLRDKAQKKGLTLALELPPSPLEAQGDSDLLQQVVRKLLDNAIKHSGGDTRVQVRGRERGEFVELEIKDEGEGIPPEQIGRIFEKFYVGDGALTRRTSGFGVGLYLVREILRLHGGSVEVDSVPGHGSAFLVRLPKRFQAAAPVA